MENQDNSKRKIALDQVPTLRDSLLGLTALNQDVVLLDFGNVIIRRNYSELKTVRLLSGGLAEADLSCAALVGTGMLTAAILGDEAAPSSRQILRVIKELDQGEKCGTFVIAQSNTELFNFGLAVERGNLDCNSRVKLLSIDDDKTAKTTRGRNTSGFVLLIKVLGAMAEAGILYNDIWECYNNIVNSIMTVPLVYEDQTGLRGRKSIRLSKNESSFHHVLDKKSRSKLGFHPSIPTVALINTSRYLDRMAELGLVKQVADRLRELGVCVVRIYLGNYVGTGKGMATLTIMKILDNKIIEYLDAPCGARGWQKMCQFLPEVTTKNEIPGLLRKKGQQEVRLKGPRLSESAANILVKSTHFACDALISCERQLNVIDLEQSAGTVGTRMKNMAEYLKTHLYEQKMPIDCPYAFFKKLSVIAETAICGTMGTIYGIFFESAANFFGSLHERELIMFRTWSDALTIALEALKGCCSPEMETTTMYYPISMCQLAVVEDLERGTNHFLESFGIGVSKAEEAAARTQLSFFKYPDAGAHAVGIWMRAIFEGVKLYNLNYIVSEKVPDK